MACTNHGYGCDCATRTILGRIAADGTFEASDVHPLHNRFRAFASHPVGVTAGTVLIIEDFEDPEIPGSHVAGVLATLAYETYGTTSEGRIAPLRKRLKARLVGYSGAGDMVVILETWREGAGG